MLAHSPTIYLQAAVTSVASPSHSILVFTRRMMMSFMVHPHPTSSQQPDFSDARFSRCAGALLLRPSLKCAYQTLSTPLISRHRWTLTPCARRRPRTPTGAGRIYAHPRPRHLRPDQPALPEQPLHTFLHLHHTLEALYCRAMHALSVVVPRMLTGLNADALANIDTPSSALVQALVLLVHASLRRCTC